MEAPEDEAHTSYFLLKVEGVPVSPLQYDESPLSMEIVIFDNGDTVYQTFSYPLYVIGSFTITVADLKDRQSIFCQDKNQSSIAQYDEVFPLAIFTTLGSGTIVLDLSLPSIVH